MWKSLTTALVLNFRIVMLVVTSLLLVVGFISILNQLNWSEPHLGLVAVEGKSFVHLTTDGTGVVEKQSMIRQLSDEELQEGKLQILKALTGKRQLDSGEELVISWDMDILTSGRKELRYEVWQGGELVDSWKEDFDSYGRMFDKIVFDLGVGGKIDIDYQLKIPTEETEPLLTMNIATRSVAPGVAFYLTSAVGLVFLGVGFIVYFSGAKRKAAHATHLFIVSLLFYIFLVFGFTNSTAPLAWFIFWCDKVAFLFAPAALLHFFYLFSIDRFSKVWTARTPVLYLPSAALLLANVIILRLERLPYWATSDRLARQSRAYVLLTKAEVVFFGILVVVGLISLLRAYRATGSVEKKIQLKWLFWGAGIGLMPTILFSFPMVLLDLDTNLVDIVVSIPLFMMPICIAYAVFRYRMMDVEVVFKRGFVYFVSSFSMVAAYLILMLSLNVFGSPIGNQTVIVIGGIVILLASLFSHRIKDNVQSFFDKIMYRDFYAFRSTLQRFSRELSYERDLDKLLNRISERIRETFHVPALMIFLSAPDRRRFLLAHSTVPGFETRYLGGETTADLVERFRTGEPMSVERLPDLPAEKALSEAGVKTLIPFVSLGEVIGFMALGSKEDGDILNYEDLDLLSSLAGRAAVSIDNAMLYSDLQGRAEEMGRLKEFSENIVESVNSGICVVSSDWIVKSWNHALEELFGVKRDDALGKPLLELLPSSLSALLRRYWHDAGEGGELIRSLYKVKVRLDGSQERILNISYAPMSTEAGGTGNVVIVDDISEWVAMEEQLVQREKLASLGMMAAGVAHEVNTPLTGISSYTQILQKKLSADEEAKQLLEKVERQTFRASRIINNLLNFSRQGAAETAEFDFNEMIRDSISLLDSQLRATHVRVATDFAPDLSLMYGDRGRLQQVIINLLLNARDSMPGGGEISVSTRNDDSSIVCAVSDTGKGMSKEIQGRIYDPFFTTKEIGQGSGLGLSVSYGIIQDHFGSIVVESEEDGGTTFIITLPVRPQVRSAAK